MKTMMKYVSFLIILIVSMANSCKEYPGTFMHIRNNSNQIIYCWYAHWIYDKNHKNYHYPDTLLPATMPSPYNIRGLIPHRASEVSGVSEIPNWKKIFSELPEGKFSVYFFTERPEKQEAWDLIRENYNLTRKDVTYQEFIDNDYIIDYP